MLGCLALAACATPVLENRQLSDLDKEGFTGGYMSYFLPKGVATVTASFDNTKKELNLEIGKAEILPDFSKHYHVAYNPSEVTSDTIVIETTKDGLLKSLSSKPVSQVVSIAEEINNVLKQFSATAKPDRKAATAIVQQNASGATDKSVPKDQTPPCGGPLKAVAYLDITNSGGKTESAESANAECVLQLDVRVDKIVNRLDSRIYTKPGEALGLSDCERVVCYRVMGGFIISADARVVLQGKVKKVETSVSGKHEIAAPVLGQIGYIRFDRKLFGTNDITATFESGVLTKLDAVHAGQISGFLKLPVELLKTVPIIVSIN
jgi:hypothetical protein